MEEVQNLIEQLKEMLDICESAGDDASVRVGLVGSKILAIIELLIQGE